MRDIIKKKRDEANAIVDRWLIRNKWWVLTHLLALAAGFAAHTIITNQTGAALRGTMFAL